MRIRRFTTALTTGALVLGLLAVAACTAADPDTPADAPAANVPIDPAASTSVTTTGSTTSSLPADTAPGASAPGAPSAPENPVAGGLLATVRQRGRLSCGVQDKLPGFGYLDPSGEYKGFDVDFCRAIAAAVLGDATAVDFKPLTAQQRFTALQTGEVDVLVRNTTFTLARDTQNGLDFSPTTFYDGQGMMVRADLNVDSLEGLDGANICVGSGTTTEKNLGDAMRKAGASFTPIVLEDTDQVFSAYDGGRCDAVTSDKSQLASRQTTLQDPTAHVVLDVTLSKEPLGPAVLQGDPQWADVVRWVVYGVIVAEEFGITSQNVDTFLTSDDPEIRRFLGVEDALGKGLGLANDFMIPVVTAVGNYAEIYDRNLGPATPFKLPRGANRLWTEGGLLYSPPFR